MKNLFVKLSLILMTSCVSYVPLTKNYKDSIIKETVINSNSYWDNIIDFFAENGIPIKNIDKQSGLIISDEFYLSPIHITGENENGNLINPNAWIASGYWQNGPHQLGPHKNITPKCKVTFLVRIREGNNGKIFVNLNVIDCNHYFIGNGSLPSHNWRFVDAQSTGVFEKDLIQRITNK